MKLIAGQFSKGQLIPDNLSFSYRVAKTMHTLLKNMAMFQKIKAIDSICI